MNLIFIILIILLQSDLILAQSIPRDHFSYKSRKLLYDAGKDWNYLTVFSPIRFKLKKQDEIKRMNSSIYIDGIINCNIGNNSYAFSGFGHFEYKNHYYGYVYPSLINKESNNHQFGIEYDVSNNYNNDYAGLGFENSWVIFQFGKGKESWGAGNEIQLALSENSKPYNYLLLGSDYGKVRVRYIHGFLENVEGNINRYITARGFEWTNKKSLIIGLSETVIYSGKNRSFDIGYLNPMSTHLEIELNNRLNIPGDKYSNAVWQLHLDFLLNNCLRFSLNYLFDEFVIDPDIEIGKEHGKAYSLRMAFTPIASSSHIFTLISSVVYIGTPTFRHGNGTNNFVNKNIPLGWEKGSDTQEFNLGFNYFNNKNVMVKIISGYYEMGEESIINRVFDTYLDYTKGAYPSGNVSSEFYFNSFYSYYWKDITLSLMLWLDWSQNMGSEIRLGFQVPFNFLLN